MKKIILINGLLLFTIISFAQNKDEQAVIEQIKAVHNAIFVQKDSLAMEKLFAKEVTYGHSGLKLENRKETIDNCSHNKSTYTDLGAKDYSVLLNGKTAVTRYVLTGVENKVDGKKVELKLHIIQTWVKEKGTWKMMARQAVKIA